MSKISSFLNLSKHPQTCISCGEKLTTVIEDDGHKVAYKCPTHGEVAGTFFGRKIRFYKRKWFWKLWFLLGLGLLGVSVYYQSWLESMVFLIQIGLAGMNHWEAI